MSPFFFPPMVANYLNDWKCRSMAAVQFEPTRLRLLSAGSLRAGQDTLAVMSLLQSARLNAYEVYGYIKNIVEKLPSWQASRISELRTHHCSPA
jgi:hypothetical protein